ncbi:hypothetical protein A7981_05545 [Methylovorus sp. MM2]|uniref:hypothetical protein n=1 Tax=Methylovorus sp. MM2 TaxID=1848038 RepID=UPI0007DFAE3A|nr:hypothetical protein [Methylovorus sp. MM2]OAM52902.1 hypothetical protein A7981_05545 [Methylovorus sp. MM2]
MTLKVKKTAKGNVKITLSITDALRLRELVNISHFIPPHRYCNNVASMTEVEQVSDTLHSKLSLIL